MERKNGVINATLSSKIVKWFPDNGSRVLYLAKTFVIIIIIFKMVFFLKKKKVLKNAVNS